MTHNHLKFMYFLLQTLYQMKWEIKVDATGKPPFQNARLDVLNQTASAFPLACRSEVEIPQSGAAGSLQ